MYSKIIYVLFIDIKFLEKFSNVVLTRKEGFYDSTQVFRKSAPPPRVSENFIITIQGATLKIRKTDYAYF